MAKAKVSSSVVTPGLSPEIGVTQIIVADDVGFGATGSCVIDVGTRFDGTVMVSCTRHLCR